MENTVPNTANTTNDMMGGKRKKKTRSTKPKVGGNLPTKKVNAKIHTGSRGGKYYIKSGEKKYI